MAALAPTQQIEAFRGVYLGIYGAGSCGEGIRDAQRQADRALCLRGKKHH